MILCAPLLYPAAAGLGADPVVLMGAVIGGVVRSRLKYAGPAALLAVVAYAVLGGADTATAPGLTATGNLAALAMAIAPAVVIALLIARRPLLEGLLTGILVAAGFGRSEEVGDSPAV